MNPIIINYGIATGYPMDDRLETIPVGIVLTCTLTQLDILARLAQICPQLCGIGAQLVGVEAFDKLNKQYGVFDEEGQPLDSIVVTEE